MTRLFNGLSMVLCVFLTLGSVSAGGGPTTTTTSTDILTTSSWDLPTTTTTTTTTRKKKTTTTTTTKKLTTTTNSTKGKPTTSTTSRKSTTTTHTTTTTTPPAAPTNANGGSIIELFWTINWTTFTVDPSGTNNPRYVIAPNNIWPIPQINANFGDTLIVHLTNALNTSTSLHFHGLFQNQTGYYDGAIGITECGVAPGMTFTYNVSLGWQAGSYWVHSHHAGQYPDGFRTALNIKNEGANGQSPLGGQTDKQTYGYTKDLTFAFADWYHDYYDHIFQQTFLTPGVNELGTEPVPNAGLLNDGPGGQVVSFVEGEVYRIRLTSMATFGVFNFWIEGHNMSIIEVDGVMVQPYQTDIVPIAAAQRYSILVTPLASSKFNYVYHYNLDESMFALPVPSNYSYAPNNTGIIQYGASFPTYVAANYTGPDPTLFSDINIAPIQAIPAFAYSENVRLDVIFGATTTKINRATFNYTTFEFPTVPALFTAVSTGANASVPAVYGKYANSHILPYMTGTQIILANLDPDGAHPFHLHGHVFQVLGRGILLTIPRETPPALVTFDYSLLPAMDLLANPLRRDTVVVPRGGYVVLRFITDNPGVWFFHCHIQWHVQTGLAAQFIEAPVQLQQRLVVPPSAYDNCRALNYTYTGNAAGFNDTTTFTGLIRSPPIAAN